MANPYQTPQYTARPTPVTPVVPHAMQPVVRPYVPIGPIAYVLLGMVVFQLLLGMLNIGASVLLLDYFYRVSVGRAAESETDLLDFFAIFASLISILVFLISVVVYLIWVYRAYRNLHALRAVEVSTTPGCAVGFHFIPFANFYLIYRGMREIWLGSHPQDLYALRSPLIKHHVGAALVGFWWALHLIANFSASFASRLMELGQKNRNIAIMINSLLIDIASDIAFIAAGLILATIVYMVSLHQEDRIELIRRSN
ncbi:MAG: DUF4328 domain-containing protein [Planctomycetaceae bacterium]|nr:DUF4328 domain-containing protein [Planctomycetaceae bacterium]